MNVRLKGELSDIRKYQSKKIYLNIFYLKIKYRNNKSNNGENRNKKISNKLRNRINRFFLNNKKKEK